MGKFVIPDDVTIQGALAVQGATAWPRSGLAIDLLKSHPLELETWKKYTDLTAPLPSTSSGSDLGLVCGVFGTNTPLIETYDLKAAGAHSIRARRSYALPPNYPSAGGLNIRFVAGMKTTIADTSATVQIEVYKCDKAGGLGANLTSSGAITINSLMFANCTCVIDPTTLNPGDVLDLRVTLAINDAASASAVIGAIGSTEILHDIQG